MEINNEMIGDLKGLINILNDGKEGYASAMSAVPMAQRDHWWCCCCGLTILRLFCTLVQNLPKPMLSLTVQKFVPLYAVTTKEIEIETGNNSIQENN